jgi:hypothetical protein
MDAVEKNGRNWSPTSVGPKCILRCEYQSLLAWSKLLCGPNLLTIAECPDPECIRASLIGMDARFAEQKQAWGGKSGQHCNLAASRVRIDWHVSRRVPLVVASPGG